MSILVIGANGQLGADVVKGLAKAKIPYFAATRNDVDITQSDEINRLFEKVKPEAVINCAAFHDVPKCEEDPSLAMEVNCFAVGSIAHCCQKHGIKFLTISTDYVFDGKRVEGYTEDDRPNPLMWYGKSKLAGEYAAFSANPKTFVVRVQSLYGENKSSKGLHFVDLMLKLSKERDELQVDQCRMSPTWTEPLANNLIALIQSEHYGLYHMSCRGDTSWYEFADTIMKLTKKQVKVIPVDNDHFPKNFVRPENTYLLNDKLDLIECNLMPTWEEAVKGYLKRIEG